MTTFLLGLGAFGRRVVPRLRALAIEMSRAASTFEPDRWSGADCAAIAEELSATAKACLAAATRAAARAVECKTRRDGPEWLARVAGTTPAEARAALSTVAAVEDCPATADALGVGSPLTAAGARDRGGGGRRARRRGDAPGGCDDTGHGGPARGSSPDHVGRARSRAAARAAATGAFGDALGRRARDDRRPVPTPARDRRAVREPLDAETDRRRREAPTRGKHRGA